MARKRTAKKGRKKQKKRRPGSSPFAGINWRPLLALLVYAAIIGGTGFGLWYFFLNSAFFEINEVVVANDRGYSFREGAEKMNRLYKGRNIFSVDLEQVQAVVQNDFPQLRKVEVRRSLPDTLEIDIISRTPVAVIDTAGGIVIDREGVVLAIGEEDKGLVGVRGMNFFLNMPSRGEKIENAKLRNALLLIEGMRRKMSEYLPKVDYVDISDRNNIVISIYGTEIKMGIDDFSRKIGDLKNMLRDPDIDMKDISYVDLRFGDPVIGHTKR